MRPKVFWFHYHKAASLAAKSNRLTVHFQGVCHLVQDVVCNVPVKTVARKEQPRCVLKGSVDPEKFRIENMVAYIG